MWLEVIIQDLTREIESFRCLQVLLFKFVRHLRHKRLVNFVGACLEIPNLQLGSRSFLGLATKVHRNRGRQRCCLNPFESF